MCVRVCVKEVQKGRKETRKQWKDTCELRERERERERERGVEKARNLFLVVTRNQCKRCTVNIIINA